jgi:hypothetical protein
MGREAINNQEAYSCRSNYKISKINSPIYASNNAIRYNEYSDYIHRYCIDYGSSGSDCMHRILARIANINYINNRMEMIDTLAAYSATFLLNKNSNIQLEQQTGQYLCMKYKIGGTLTRAEFYQLWKTHLKSHDGKLDLLALNIIAEMNTLRFRVTLGSSTVEIDNSRNMNTKRINILLIEGERSCHAILCTQTPKMPKAPNTNISEVLLCKPIGGLNEKKPLIDLTNQIRAEHEQEGLTLLPNMRDFDPHGHDPGEFRQLTTLSFHGNLVRALFGQEPLQDSQSLAYRDMYNVNFHEKDTEIDYVDGTGSTLDSKIERYYADCKYIPGDDDKLDEKEAPQ